MTPERIAELRSVAAVADTGGHGFSAPWQEMLDEIERLRGLVEQSHGTRISIDFRGVTAGFEMGEVDKARRYVLMRTDGRPRYFFNCWHHVCFHKRAQWRQTWDEAVADAAAHVAEILGGGAT